MPAYTDIACHCAPDSAPYFSPLGHADLDTSIRVNDFSESPSAQTADLSSSRFEEDGSCGCGVGHPMPRELKQKPFAGRGKPALEDRPYLSFSCLRAKLEDSNLADTSLRNIRARQTAGAPVVDFGFRRSLHGPAGRRGVQRTEATGEKSGVAIFSR